MTRRSQHGSSQPSTGNDLALARERFLITNDLAPDVVRPTISASWQRSATWNIATDQLTAPYQADLDTEQRLVRASTTVLDRLRTELADQPVSVILTNSNGYVLDKRTGKSDLEHQLDTVQLAPGFSYAEQFVGTNGIGTALEAGQATYVYQREHYTEQLGELACAGVPVHSPTTRQVEGLLDITCWAEDASPLLMAIARSAAQSIEAALLAHARGSEITLLNEYLRASRRCLDPVLAFNADVFMLNDKARELLDSQDQAAVSEYLRDRPMTSERVPLEMVLPSGSHCRVHSKQVLHGHQYAGTLARLQFTEPEQHFDVPALGSSPTLPGLAGSGPLWKQACRLLDCDFRERNWTVVEGEPGVGKLALIQAVRLHHSPDTHIRTFDAADAASNRNWTREVQRELDTRDGIIVFRHLDQLGSKAVKRLNSMLQKHADDTSNVWIAATLNKETKRSSALNELLGIFSCSVEVPPLRHHIEDIEEIAPLILQQATKRSDTQFSSTVMRRFLRKSWPGNIAELNRVIHLAVKRNRAGTITLDDLPPECHSQNRRVLSPIESMERDTIVRALTESGGNRARAARSLGISRATIYRKINEYGIDPSTGSS